MLKGTRATKSYDTIIAHNAFCHNTECAPTNKYFDWPVILTKDPIVAKSYKPHMALMT